ncbi:hypothetical protein Vi05172_g5133 [Venturia inaequalis]|nr:hypothetical protein Vi05172_g5133 [Venturia inaequalis]
MAKVTAIISVHRPELLPGLAWEPGSLGAWDQETCFVSQADVSEAGSLCLLEKQRVHAPHHRA